MFDDVELDDRLIGPIATDLRESDFDLGRTVRRILSSNLFFSDRAIGQKVRGPVELAIGMLRTIQASTNFDLLADRVEELGQLPFFPPNVKGWNGGRTWINASTLLSRANLVRELVTSQQTVFEQGSFDGWLAANDVRRPDQIAPFLLSHLVAVKPRNETIATLNELAKNESSRTRAESVISAIATLPEFQLC